MQVEYSPQSLKVNSRKKREVALFIVTFGDRVFGKYTDCLCTGCFRLQGCSSQIEYCGRSHIDPHGQGTLVSGHVRPSVTLGFCSVNTSPTVWTSGTYGLIQQTSRTQKLPKTLPLIKWMLHISNKKLRNTGAKWNNWSHRLNNNNYPDLINISYACIN